MSNSYDLLKMTTNLLAYAGDDESQDGYNTQVRPVPLSVKQLKSLVDQLKRLLSENKVVKNLPKDIIDKMMELKARFDAASQDEKEELLEYLEDLEIGGMHGGKRRKNKKSRKAKRSTKKGCKGSRTRKLKRSSE